MASDLKTTNFSLAALGASNPIQYANGFVSLYVAGTFVGTIQLQAQNNGNAQGFVPIIALGQTTPNITAPGVYLFPHTAGDFTYEAVCTAYTAGTLVGTLSACPTN